MKINIIGAGITGLSAAYFFIQKGHQVKVFESNQEVGGLAGSIPINGTTIEKYYHHSFAGHAALIALMEDLNIEEKMVYFNTKMGFFYKDRVYPFVTPQDLLSFKPLKIKNRVRLGLTSMFMMSIKDWEKLEKQSAIEWLNRYSGEEACRNIWEPLLRMKFGDDFNRISAAWLWNRVVDRKGKGKGKDVLGYIKGGYKILFDRLVESIMNHGGEINLKTSVNKILVENGACIGIKSNTHFFDGDIVISTIPLPSFLKIIPSLSDGYMNELMSIKYQGSICVLLKLKKKLSDYYWINMSEPESPFVGIVEHTNLISPSHYGDHHLVYLSKYTSSQSKIFTRSGHNIYRDFISYLKKIFPSFNENSVVEYYVFMDRFSQPVFIKNYSQMIPNIRTPIKNLYLLNTAQFYPQSRSINTSIEKAHLLVKEVVADYDR